MSTSCHRHRILDGGGSTPYGQAYFQACQNRQSPVLAQVISPALELLHHLHIDIDGIKREEDWEPIMKALRINGDLKEIRLRSNMGPGMQGALDAIPAHGSAGSSDGGDDSASMNTNKNVKLNFATKRGLPEALRKKDKVTRGSAQIRMGRVALKLSGAIKDCLVRSLRISVLEIAGVYLPQNALDVLQRGLAGNGTLKELSLARSNIGDDGLFTLIPGIKAAKSLCSISLAACQITTKGAEFLSDLIKSQAVQRQAAKWVSTLRAHPMDPMREGYATQDIYAASIAGPTLDIPLGTPTPIRRLNLCCNRLGDNGLDILLEGLVEEIGMLAIDLQYNEITDAGGRIAEQLVRINGELVILDLRNNRIDPILLRVITSLLQVNMNRRIKASHIPSNGKTQSPQVVEWLSDTHPLESTYHSTSTTPTSSVPYEAVRTAIRNANVLSHLRRHTSSSINKQTFASTKDAEAEMRRKRRKWEEVEAAAKMRIPKGNLPKPKPAKTKAQAKAKSKVGSLADKAYAATKIPSAAWIEPSETKLSNIPPFDGRVDELDMELEEISGRLGALFKSHKNTDRARARKWDDPKEKVNLEISREAELRAENLALRQQLNSRLARERESPAVYNLPPSMPPSREHRGFELPTSVGQQIRPPHAHDAHHHSLNDEAVQMHSASKLHHSGPASSFGQSGHAHHTPIHAWGHLDTTNPIPPRHGLPPKLVPTELSPLDQLMLDNLMDQIPKSHSRKPKKTSPNPASITLDKLASELDDFISKEVPQPANRYHPAGEEVHEIQIQGERKRHSKNAVLSAVTDTYSNFIGSRVGNESHGDQGRDAAMLNDIVASYLGMSTNTLLGDARLDLPASDQTEILKVVDESLSNFLQLLEDIECTDEAARGLATP
ncbi:Centrosomal protein of 78 kDa [Chytriomyces hyalinus]|nr:Centrosomal protein of 78 kDa [Chytriomyces hyalinus]